MRLQTDSRINRSDKEEEEARRPGQHIDAEI